MTVRSDILGRATILWWRSRAMLGWAGFVGAVALIVATALALDVRRMTQQMNADAVADAAVATQPTDTQSENRSATASPAQVWQSFNLSTSDEAAQVVAHLEEAARQFGLSWKQGAIQYTPINEQSLGYFTLEATLTGRYPAFKSWADAASRGQYGLSLQSWALTRNHADSSEIDVAVQWRWYVRDGWAETLNQPESAP